jgi:hypothetical protein
MTSAFNLQAANHPVFGTSQMSSANSREAGTAS